MTCLYFTHARYRRRRRRQLSAYFCRAAGSTALRHIAITSPCAHFIYGMACSLYIDIARMVTRNALLYRPAAFRFPHRVVSLRRLIISMPAAYFSDTGDGRLLDGAHYDIIAARLICRILALDFEKPFQS